MLHRSQPGSVHSHTQLPRDAPHRSTLETFIPLSPIGLFPRKRYVRVLLTRNASAKTWKRWQAERQADDPWQNRNQRLLFQKAFHLHWKLKTDLKWRNDFFYVFLRTNAVKLKIALIQNLKWLVMLRYLKRRTSCVQICADYKAYRCIHVSPAFHAKASTYPALPCVKHCGIVAQHKIIESLPNKGQSILILKELSPKQFYPACMTFPLRLLFPQNYHRFHVQEQCLHHSHAANSPKAY